MLLSMFSGIFMTQNMTHQKKKTTTLYASKHQNFAVYIHVGPHLYKDIESLESNYRCTENPKTIAGTEAYKQKQKSRLLVM